MPDVLVRLMIDHLINYVSQLGHWAYLIIGLGVLLEASAFLGFVVPGETLVLLGGFLASQGVLKLKWLIAINCVAAIVGDSIGYEVGRHLGRPWLLAHGHWVHLHEDRLCRVEDFFHNHGGKAVILGRFSAFLRAMLPFVAGSSHMRYSRFLFYNAAGGILWATSFTIVGYFVGHSWRMVEHWVGRIGAVVAGLIIAGVIGLWVWRRRVHRRRQGLPEPSA